MLNRFGLDRFKKAQSAEPFSVNTASATTYPQKPSLPPLAPTPTPTLSSTSARPTLGVAGPPQIVTLERGQVAAGGEVLPTPPSQTSAVGEGRSTWQPPDWAVEPRAGTYWLDVMKDGEVVDKIQLGRRRHIFGRQILMCDFVLDHPSISRQHAVVVHHKNGSVYVIDLGSVHGTFVANERVDKDNPAELEVGQSLRFAASTRIYILRKNVQPPPSLLPKSVNIALPPPPDPADEEAVVAYNTLLNRFGLSGAETATATLSSTSTTTTTTTNERPSKRARKAKVTFRDQYDGVLVEVVGISDGAGVSTEPGPSGVKEGSLVGKYGSLVQVTVIPKGQEAAATKPKEDSTSPRGVTEKLQKYLEKVKSPGKGPPSTISEGGLYGDIYGGSSLSGKIGGSWANISTADSVTNDDIPPGSSYSSDKSRKMDPPGKLGRSKFSSDFVDEDLFGEDEND